MENHLYQKSINIKAPTASFFKGLQKSMDIYLTTFRDLQAALPLLNSDEGFNKNELKLNKHELKLKNEEQKLNKAELFLKKKVWAEKVFKQLAIDFEIHGAVKNDEPSLFVGNHLSYLDIPFLMMSAPHVSFVAKEELKKWPIFGPAAKAVGTVFVNRGSVRSRGFARETIIQNIKAGKSVAIFPSGTTAMNENKNWKKGSFEIAQEGNFWVQPFRISYSPTRACAYIDDDFFLTHLIRLAQRSEVSARIEFHPPIKIKNPVLDCLMVQRWTQGVGEIY